MNLIINGENKKLSGGISTVLCVLDELKLNPRITIVEKNKEIVNKDQYGETPVADGDIIELIRYMGGG